jgi:hypothetical protein
MIQAVRTRTGSPPWWMKAAERAIAKGVQVRQLACSGQWIECSGSNAWIAFEVEVTGRVAHGCGCLAGLNGDPVCKHRAAFYLLIGVITLTPQPDPPALGATGECPDCNGCGVHYSRELERLGLLYPTCRRCNGTGVITVPALRPAA